MANIEQQVVKMMAQEIVRAIKKMNEDNNKNYVDNQLKNYKGLEKVIVSGGGGNIGGSIDASQVTGLYGAVAGYIANSPDYALAGDLDAGRIITTISGIAAIEVESATIDTAQIENLYASYGEFINLVAKNAEIENLDVEQVRADIATMGLANIDSAKIGWAQIEGLVADTALIRQGVGGKLYIDDLAVTEAQILTLFTGELVLQGTNGKLYTIYLDEEGKLKTKERSITGSDIADGSIEGSNIASGSIEGTNIAENTITGALITEHGITARELNVSQIFADEALINAIKAANIDVDDLFASTAFINSLTTSIIKSPTIGNELDVSNNSSIVLTDKKLGLIVSSESSESELILTDQMLDIIANKVKVYADNIDFSANESITAIVQKEIAEISNNVFVGNEPTSPEVDMIWLDTNVSPNLFKVWDGEKWNVVNDVTSIASRIDSAELKINSLDASITSTSKSVDDLNDRVDIAEEKIKPDSIVQTVRSNDAYKADIAQATMTSDKFESFVANSSGISSISQTANKVNLIVKSESTETNVQLTDKAIETISERVQINAEQVVIKVGNESSTVEEVLTPEGITTLVSESDAYSTLESKIEQNAGRIGLIVANEDSSSELELTPEAISLISDSITVEGKSLTVIAGSATKANTRIDNFLTNRNYLIQTYRPYTAYGVGLDTTLTYWFPCVCPSLNLVNSLYGQTVTISYDYVSNVTEGYATFSTNNVWQLIRRFYPEDTTGHEEYTMTLNNHTATDTKLVYMTGKFSGSVTISNLKIELGNKATEWSPAPEDLKPSGINLAKNTEKAVSGTATDTNGGSHAYTIADMYWRELYIRIDESEKYTLSFDYEFDWSKCASAMPSVLSGITINLFFGDGVKGSNEFKTNVISQQADYMTYGDGYSKGKFVLTFDKSKDQAYPYFAFRPLRSYGPDITGLKITISNFMLEKGCAATSVQGYLDYSVPYDSSEPPTETPATGKLWIDRKSNPPIFKKWKGLPVEPIREWNEDISSSSIFINNYDNHIEYVDSLVSTFTPSLSGSGNPSPSNYRALVGIAEASIVKYGKNIFNVVWSQGSINSSTGVEADNTTIVRTNFIPVAPGKTYSITRTITGNSFAIRCYDANKTYLGAGEVGITLVEGYSTNNPMQKDMDNATFTIKAGTYYLRFIDYTNNISTKLMIEESNVSTTFEDYKEERRTASFGKILYGGEIDWLKGIWKQTYWEYTITGDESISVSTVGDNRRFAIIMPKEKTLPALEFTPVCTHLLGNIAPYNGNVTDNTICLDKNVEENIPLYLRCDRYTTVDELRTWIKEQYSAGTPVRVSFKLKSPIVYRIDPLELSIEKTGVHVQVSSTTLNMPLFAKCICSGWETINNVEDIRGNQANILAAQLEMYKKQQEEQQAIDFATPHDSEEPPATAPAAGKLWIDRGTTPPIFRRWKGKNVSTDREWDHAFALGSGANPNAYYDNSTGLLERIDSVMTVFTPGQSGSGNPTPSNYRPLTGYTYMNCLQNSYGQTAKTFTKAELTFGKLVYGAEIDWLSGTWKQTHMEYVLTGEETITLSTPWGINRFAVFVRTLTDPAASYAPVCSHLLGNVAPYNGNAVDNAICIDINFTDYILMYIRCDAYATVDALKAWLRAQYAAGTPVRVVYKLKEPITYSFTPANIEVFDSYLYINVGGYVNGTYSTAAPKTLSVTGTLSGWETLNSVDDIRAAQTQIQEQQQNAQAAIDELRTAVVTDNEGVHVRKVDNDDVQLTQNEVLITQKDVNIVSGGVRNSSFGSGYVRLLDMVIRVASNGIVIEAAEV